MATQNYANQFFYGAAGPLDATSAVDNLSDLTDTSANKKLIPYIGKLVHVRNEHKYYICSSVNIDTNNRKVGVWSPVFSEDGTALFLRDSTGKIYEITANEGRLDVSIEGE